MLFRYILQNEKLLATFLLWNKRASILQEELSILAFLSDLMKFRKILWTTKIPLNVTWDILMIESIVNANIHEIEESEDDNFTKCTKVFNGLQVVKEMRIQQLYPLQSDYDNIEQLLKAHQNIEQIAKISYEKLLNGTGLKSFTYLPWDIENLPLKDPVCCVFNQK